MGVTASEVLITPCTIQGWRSSSVTIQPASTAAKPRMVDSAIALRNSRESNNRPRHHSTAAHNARNASQLPDRDHDLEGEVHGSHRRPEITRNVVESGHRCCRIAMCQKAQASGDLQCEACLSCLDIGYAADPQRSVRLSRELTFECLEFGRLRSCDDASSPIAGERL